MMITIRQLINLLFVTLCVNVLIAQNRQWESMYSYNNTTLATVLDDRIVTAADNAIFVYNTTQNTFETITTIEGLSGENFSAIAIYENYILAGQENGTVAKVNSISKEVKLDSSIERNSAINANEKTINDIYVTDDTAYLSTGFGIVELNPLTLEFGDTYYFGSTSSRIAVMQTLVYQDQLYAATDQGIYRTSLNNAQRLQFSSWEQVSSGKWTAIWNQDGNVFAAQDLGNAVSFHQCTPTLVEKVRFSGAVKHVEPHENGVVLTLSKVYKLDKTFLVKETISDIEEVSNNTYTFGIVYNGETWLGTSDQGLIRYTSPENYNFVSPQGPLKNSIFDIESLSNELWIAHGDYTLFYDPSPGRRYGLSHSKEGQWINIKNSALFNAINLSRVVVHPTIIGTAYACSFTSGIVLLEDNTPAVLWNQNNSGLESLSFEGPDYVSIRVRDVVVDEQGNLWSITTFVKEGLKKLSPTGQWTSFDLSEVVLDYKKEAGYSNLELFNNKYLFFGSLNSGLIGVDISQSPPQMKRIMGGDNGLPSDDIRSIRLDKDNRLWVGTREGIAVLYAPNRFFEEDTQLRSIVISDGGNLRELLSGQLITDIEVDGNNQKWISTANAGVFLVSPDGTETLQYFTKENSPLPTSSVKTIGIDNGTGKVFLGTLKGMVSFQGDAYQESESLDQVNVFPNPVRPNYTGKLTIRGLQQNARIKITDIAGNLVHDTSSEGGSISWDLRSFSGKRVASGVYLIFVSTKDGLDSTVKKVMIIN